MPEARQDVWKRRLEVAGLVIFIVAVIALMALAPAWAAEEPPPPVPHEAIWVGAVVGCVFTVISGTLSGFLLWQVKRAGAASDHRMARIEEQWTRLEERLADTRENYVTRSELADGLKARDEVVDQRFTRLNDKVDRANDRCDRLLIRVERVEQKVGAVTEKVEGVQSDVVELRAESRDLNTKLDQVLEYLAPGGQRV